MFFLALTKYVTFSLSVSHCQTTGCIFDCIFCIIISDIARDMETWNMHRRRLSTGSAFDFGFGFGYGFGLLSFRLVFGLALGCVFT